MPFPPPCRISLGMTDKQADPPSLPSEASDPLAELRRRARLQEYQFTSAVPLIGPLIAWFRHAWNSVATKWYVRPLMAQQTAMNLALVDQLEKLQGVAAVTATEMETWFVDEDREQTCLTRHIAELELRTRWQGRQTRAGTGSVEVTDHPIKIAYFSPLPPARSGIADYSAELLPYLAQQAEITLFTNSPDVIPVAGLPVRLIEEYAGVRDQFDIALYQMGNSEHHEAIYDCLIRYPGVVVLHDYTIHHFVRHHTQNEGEWTGYGRELAYALGTEGRQLARDIRSGKAIAPLFTVPLNERLIDTSLALIVHSEYAAAGIRRRRPELPLAVIPAPVEPRAGHSLRSRLGLSDEAVLFGSFGQITAEKQPELILRALRRVRESHPEAHLLFAGEARPDIGDKLADLIESSGLTGYIHNTGYSPDLAEFIDWIHTADVVINLRQPTAGETSAVALRAMAAGRPLIVFDHGWYREIPAEIALKVAPLDEPGLTAAMDRLAGSERLRRQMGESALAYACEVAHPDRVAAATITFIRKTVEQIVSVSA